MNVLVNMLLVLFHAELKLSETTYYNIIILYSYTEFSLNPIFSLFFKKRYIFQMLVESIGAIILHGVPPKHILSL